MPRQKMEADVRALVAAGSLHSVVHALVELCYEQVSKYHMDNDHRRADDYHFIARQLTQVEKNAQKCDM